MAELICNAPFCENPKAGGGKKKAYCNIHTYEREKYNIKSFVEFLPLWAVKRCEAHGLLKPSQANPVKGHPSCRSCNTCRRERNAASARHPLTKEKRRDNLLKKRYKISQKQYELLEKKQNYRCAICNNPHDITKHGKKKSFQIDHCHEKEKHGEIHIRGLLCSKCNMGLGSFNDDPSLMFKAIEYLRSNQ